MRQEMLQCTDMDLYSVVAQAVCRDPGPLSSHWCQGSCPARNNKRLALHLCCCGYEHAMRGAMGTHQPSGPAYGLH